ncbi:hypothetical protein [Oceanobacillus sp. CAU 1775]
MESNKKEEHIKEYLTKEIDSIKVPKGLKEELWTEIKTTRKKKMFHSKLLPYIAAIAVVALFIPLVLSLLPTSEMASDEFSGKTLDVSARETLTDPDILTPVIRLEFEEGNIVKNAGGYEEGTYELNGDKLMILMEDDNEKVEIELTLHESDKDFILYRAEVTNVDYQMNDWDQISKYRGFMDKFRRYPSYELIQK